MTGKNTVIGYAALNMYTSSEWMIKKLS